MIRAIGWCAVVAALVALGWFGRDAVAAPDRAPVTVSVAVSAQPAPKPAVSAKAAPKPRPAPERAKPAEYREPPETNDAVGPWTPKGIGYYDVRQAAGLKY